MGILMTQYTLTPEQYTHQTLEIVNFNGKRQRNKGNPNINARENAKFGRNNRGTLKSNDTDLLIGDNYRLECVRYGIEMTMETHQAIEVKQKTIQKRINLKSKGRDEK